MKINRSFYLKNFYKQINYLAFEALFQLCLKLKNKSKNNLKRRRGANIGKILGASNIDLFDKRWTIILLNFANL